MSRITEVLNFEGLGANESQVEDGYGGLSWKGASVYTPGDTGFGANGVHSGESLIYNADAQPMSFYSHSAFAVKRGNFSAAQEDDVTVTFTGYAAGKEVVQHTVELDQMLSVVRFKDPAWSHVNRVVVSTDNGVNPSYSQVTIDDLKLKVHASASSSAEAEGAHAGEHLHHHADPQLSFDAHTVGFDAGGLVV